MPLPLIVVWIGIGVASLLVGTSIAVKWDDIQIALKGKRLAVFGARGVGKTHLIEFLATGSIPAEYKQTVAPEKATSRRFQLKELDLKVKDTLDISGDKAAYGEWKELYNQADVVFYLLRADRLITGDKEVEIRVKQDLHHIGDWLKERGPQRPNLFIVGTHCDLDDNFNKLPKDKIGEYVDRFQRLPIARQLIAHGGGAQKTKIVLGSMKTLSDAEALVYQIFMQVVS